MAKHTSFVIYSNPLQFNPIRCVLRVCVCCSSICLCPQTMSYDRNFLHAVDVLFFLSYILICFWKRLDGSLSANGPCDTYRHTAVGPYLIIEKWKAVPLLLFWDIIMRIVHRQTQSQTGERFVFCVLPPFWQLSSTLLKILFVSEKRIT